MYKLEDIRSIHLEVTEKCQAGCPICPRHTDDGSVNPFLINAELSISSVRKFFSRPFVKQLQKMYMCGNYGDPIIAKDTLEIFEYFRYNNTSMKLDMHTNGGARTSDWWKDLAHVLHNDSSLVVFSFDGLSDTNHIYRKNVNWDIAMNSAKSFIEAGGNAVWSFIVFKHNEHQVEEARSLSEKMGFKNFVAKKSARFRGPTKHPYLQMPTNPTYQNKNLSAIDEITKVYGTMDDFYDQAEISCAAKAHKSIYVSARGFVFPCCWLDLSNGMINNSSKDRLLEIYGSWEACDLNKVTLEDIFNKGIFDTIQQSWSCKSTKEGRMRVCAINCSKEYNFFRAQFE